MSSAVLVRRQHFSCGHRYFNPSFSEDKNKEVFGPCYSEHGHGHNYIIEAYFKGHINPETGMVLNLVDVDKILKNVTEKLDHKFLNEDIEAFKETVPTTENVAKYCYENICSLCPSDIKISKVKLFENSELWVEYDGR